MGLQARRAEAPGRTVVFDGRRRSRSGGRRSLPCCTGLRRRNAAPFLEGFLKLGKFAAQLTGIYDGLGGDETAVPDFYDEYGAQRGKPVAIPETAALVVPRGADAAERAIQQAWWRQVFSPDTHERFPQLRLVNWFEWVKLEDEVGETVHWAVLPDETTRAAFRADLPGWLRYADAVRCVSR